MKRASRRLGGGFRRASEGFKGASERFERGFEQGSKGAFERVAPPDHLRLKPITCASNSAPQPTHLRPPPCLPLCHALNYEFLFKLLPPCLPQCHDLHSEFLFKLPLPLAFHNATI